METWTRAIDDDLNRAVGGLVEAELLMDPRGMNVGALNFRKGWSREVTSLPRGEEDSAEHCHCFVLLLHSCSSGLVSSLGVHKVILFTWGN